MRNKAYDDKLKKKHDPVGKEITRQIMADVFGAQHVRDNLAEDAGNFSEGFWDQVYQLPDGRKFAVEPEIKDKKWFGEEFKAKKDWKWPFKYPTVDIPFRKAKNKAALFFVISSCQKYAIMVTRKAMDDSVKDGPKIKNTIYMKNEPFYSVSLGNTVFLSRNFKTKKWKVIYNGHQNTTEQRVC